MKHSYLTETRSLVRTLRRHGWEPSGSLRGEELIQELMACDCCWHRFNHAALAAHTSLFLVYGNGPGELVADYTLPNDMPAEAEADLDSIISEHDERWAS